MMAGFDGEGITQDPVLHWVCRMTVLGQTLSNEIQTKALYLVSTMLKSIKTSDKAPLESS